MALVTLLTDFRTSDGYVGAMKGVLYSRAPGVRVADVSHDIPAHDIGAAAHALTNTVPYFPAGTIHICVVDPGVGSERKAVIVVHKDQLLVGPDNGVFSLVAPRATKAYEISEAAFLRDRPSMTFHGRDVFAAAAAELARGGRPEDAGPQVVLRGRLPQEQAEGAAACVTHIDVFGNLITNIARKKVPDSAGFRIAGRDISSLSESYSNVGEGELVAYIGSRETLEFAIRGGNAAETLGASRKAVVELVVESDPEVAKDE
ncbi:MAG: SAM-dependent chlorinase/fluorinase [Myxococcales bacterium]|nr:SAM-dependent chlorinase/fluorinase [Myxococcales bacterium]